MSSATHRALATVVNPDGARRRDSESFGRDRPVKPTRAGDGNVAHLTETETSRRAAVLEVVARTGDRTGKGRHPMMPTFRVTRRYASFAIVKTSGVAGMRTSDLQVMNEQPIEECSCGCRSRGTSKILALRQPASVRPTDAPKSCIVFAKAASQRHDRGTAKTSGFFSDSLSAPSAG